MKYKIVRGIDRELRFLPECIDYEEAYASFAVVADNVDEKKIHELMVKRQETPSDKIFSLDKDLNIVYYNRYTEEEKKEIERKSLIKLYENELNIANKFFQEYNFQLNGTQEDFISVKEYLKNLKNGIKSEAPIILKEYR